jgi:GST-like protein
MAETDGYKPPKVWVWETPDGGVWGEHNRPLAGASHDSELPVGRHPLQLYSLGTPNGVKVTVLLEELLALGHEGAEYDAWLVEIFKGEQFGSGFVAINPNSKIPAMVDRSYDPPVRIFESGAILTFLAEKFGEFLPTEPHARAECQSWLFWQMASTPYLGGGFGHFYMYAPVKIEYAINRYTIEIKRQLDVLNRRLEGHEFIAGEAYTIADMAIWPWYGLLVSGDMYENSAAYFQIHEYTHLRRWAEAIGARPAVKRGSLVNRVFQPEVPHLRERHDASDFDGLV